MALGFLGSTRTVQCSNGTVAGPAGGPATYTLAEIKSMCPNAMVVGFGVNIGTNNPGYTVRTDLFNFNGTIYDFEVNDCEHDGEHGGDQNAQQTGHHSGQTSDHNHDQCGDNSG